MQTPQRFCMPILLLLLSLLHMTGWDWQKGRRKEKEIPVPSFFCNSQTTTNQREDEAAQRRILRLGNCSSSQRYLSVFSREWELYRRQTNEGASWCYNHILALQNEDHRDRNSRRPTTERWNVCFF